MTEFSYQLYSSRNFPPLSDTLKMLGVDDISWNRPSGLPYPTENPF